MRIIPVFFAVHVIHCQAEHITDASQGISAEVRPVPDSEQAAANAEAGKKQVTGPSEVLVTSSGHVQTNGPTMRPSLAVGGSSEPAKHLSTCSGTDFHYSSFFDLSEEQMNRAEVNTAGAFRLRRLYEKLMQGSEEISVAVLGGSVEHCHTCPIFTHTWHQYVLKWLKKAFSLKNIPSTMIIDVQDKIELKSAFDFSNKTQAKDLKKYDLVFIAGLSNYPLRVPKDNTISYVKGIEINRQYAEVLLRDLLATPGGPAVLIVAWLNDHWWETSTAHDMSQHTGMAYRWGTWQDEVYQFLAMYYEVSMVSGRNALLHSVFTSSANPNLEPRFTHEELVVDRLHPTPLGHELFGQLVISFLCKQLKSIQDSPPPVAVVKYSREHQLPPAIFSNASHQVTLRRVADLSGFPEDMILDLVSANGSGEEVEHTSANWTANPDDVRPMDKREGLMSVGIFDSGSTANASNISSLIDPDVFFKHEFRAAFLPLAFWEAMCWARQGVARSVVVDLPEEDAAAQGSAHRPFALEPFRFLAVAHIVLFHDGTNYPSIFGDSSKASFVIFGQYWVPFFFALSGYVLYLSQRGVAKVVDPLDFVKRRVWRVYPMFFLGVLVSLSATGAPLNAARCYATGQLLPGFLLVDSWAEPYGVTSPNGPAWFLCTLFSFWLCFPHWYSFVYGLRTGWFTVLFAYLSSFCIPLAYKASALASHEPHFVPPPTAFASFHPMCNWPAFVFGMGIARLSTEIRVDRPPRFLQQTAASAALFAILLVFNLLPWPMPGCPGGSLEILMLKGPLLLPLYGILLFFVPAGQDLLLRPSILESPTGLWLGSVSGPMFALHWPIRTWMVSKSVQTRAWAIVAAQLLAAFTYQHAEESLRGKSHGSSQGFARSSKASVCEPGSSDREAGS